MNARKYTGILLSLLPLCLGLLLCTIFNPTLGIKSESVAINLDPQRTLVGRIYTPNAPKPHPTMLLCHGVNNSREMMAALGVELARNGIAAIAFDFGGYGESYSLTTEQKSIANLEVSTLADAEAVLDFVRDRPLEFDGDRLGVLGHSMGGTTALHLAQKYPQLRATILLGMTGLATVTTPPNLFLGVGLYEQINPPHQFRTMLQQATNSDRPPCINSDRICGDFSTGTARQLFVSGTADHVIEPYDPQLMRQVVNWAQRALDLPIIEEKPIVTPWFILSLLIAFAGGITAGVSIFLRSAQPLELPAMHSGSANRTTPRTSPRQLWRYCVSTLLVILMAVIWGMGANGLSPTIGASNMLIFCYVLQLSSNYALRYPEKILKALRIASLYSLLFLVAFLLPAICCGIPEIFHAPLPYLANLPQFLFQWPFFIVYNYTQGIKLALLPSYTLALQPSLLFVFLVLLELIRPGMTFTAVERVAVWGVKWLRRPFTFTGIGRVDRSSAILLVILLLLLAVILYQRVADGLIQVAASKGFLALQMVGMFLFLPLAVIVLGVRSAWLRRLES